MLLPLIFRSCRVRTWTGKRSLDVGLLVLCFVDYSFRLASPDFGPVSVPDLYLPERVRILGKLDLSLIAVARHVYGLSGELVEDFFAA